VVAIAADEGPEPESTGGSMSEMMMKRYGLLPKAGAAAPAAAAATNKPVVLSSNELSVVNVTFRAVNLRRYSPTANDDLAYALDSQLRTNAMFDASGTKLDGKIENVDNEAPSFSFGMTLTLKRPLKLQ
jgi:hypothetical protein